MIPLEILSLGAGVQSSALLLMSAEGLLHRQAVPLPMADLRTKDERRYGMANECSGMCGV